MSAAEYLAEAAALAAEVALVQGVTVQQQLRGLVAPFDFDAPLPDLHIRAVRGWEVGQ